MSEDTTAQVLRALDAYLEAEEEAQRLAAVARKLHAYSREPDIGLASYYRRIAKWYAASAEMKAAAARSLNALATLMTLRAASREEVVSASPERPEPDGVEVFIPLSVIDGVWEMWEGAVPRSRELAES